MLSHPLPVVALVSHYLTNKLMGHRLLSIRKTLHRNDLCPPMTIRNYSEFLRVMPKIEVDYQCVTLPFAMLCLQSIRLACLKHAASVHPEPGSNSQIKLKF